MSVFYGDAEHAGADAYTLAQLAYERAERIAHILSDNPEYSEAHDLLEV